MRSPDPVSPADDPASERLLEREREELRRAADAPIPAAPHGVRARVRPTISVVIPVYNHADVIAGAIESALNQTVPPDEIVVVDDCSEDAEALVQALEPWIRDHGVHLHRTPRNSGPAAARNIGICASHGDLVALLDADARHEPEPLETAVDTLLAPPETAMTCADAFQVHRGAMLPGRKNDQWQPIEPVVTFERLLEGNCISTLPVVMRRETYDAFGPFDEAPDLVGVEDYDLWLRVSKAREIRYVDRPLARYAKSPESISGDPRRLFRGEAAVFDKLERVVDGFQESHGAIAARRRHEMRVDLAYNLCTTRDWREALRVAVVAVARRPLSVAGYRVLARALLRRTSGEVQS